MKFFPHKILFFLQFIIILSSATFNIALAGLPPPPPPRPMIGHSTADSLSDALFESCSDTNSTTFDSHCRDALTEADSDDNVLHTLSPDEIIANNTNINGSAINSGFSRLGSLRILGEGSSADTMFSALSIYTNGHSSWQDYNAEGFNPGFTFFDSKAVLGADYRFSDNFILGLSTSFLNSTSKIKQGTDIIDSDGYGFAIYGSFFSTDKFHIDGSFAYSDQQHNTQRSIVYPGSDQLAVAEVDSNTFSAGLNAGYNFYFNGWTFTPTMLWMYRSIQLDKYAETLSDPDDGGGNLALAIADHEYESITGNFGAQISYAWNQSWGVLVPTLSATFVHEFSNGEEEIRARFASAPKGKGTFTISTTAMDSDYVTISAGVSAQFSQGVSGYLNYGKILDLSSLTSDSVSMGIRVQLD